MNPYKSIPGLYTAAVRSQYTCAPLAELGPHIWAMSREAHTRMHREGANQVCRSRYIQ